jgi:competence protein ComEA
LSGEEKRIPDAARWAAVIVLGLAGVAGVLRAWVAAPPRMLEHRPAAPSTAHVVAGVDSAPAMSEPAAPSEKSEAPVSAARRINVNSASAAELDLLPGIGPALAGRIIADREANGPFRTLDDLDRVSGIGPKTVAKLAPYATAN